MNSVSGVACQNEISVETDKSTQAVQRRHNNDTNRMKKNAVLTRKKLTERWKERSKIITYQQVRYVRKLKEGFKNRQRRQLTTDGEIDLEVRLLKKLLMSGHRLLSLLKKRRVTES